MRNKILIALIVGLFCHCAHTMQQNLLEQLQKDADQLTAESIDLIEAINKQIKESDYALTQAYQPQQSTAPAIDISVNWKELWKKVGALEHLLKLNIVPMGGTPAEMQASFDQLNRTYDKYREREQYRVIAPLLALTAQAATYTESSHN
jgi:hypothetical protein